MEQAENVQTKQCKYCLSEIPVNAKVCPHCRKKQKSGKGKWIALGIAAVIVIAAVAGGGKKQDKADTPEQGARTAAFGSTERAGAAPAEAPAEQVEQTEQNAEADAAEDSVPEAEAGAVYHVGDSVMDGKLKITYVASGEYQEENEFMQPKAGYHYIYLRFAFENGADASDRTASSFDFDCFADGYAADAYYGGDENLSATLSAGRSTMGCVYYEVPDDAQDIEVEYEINVFSDKKVTFSFEGSQDSGYTVQQSGDAAAELYGVGDTVDAGTLKITYLSCGVYTSDNMFLQPKDGCRYVQCAFEFENTGKSDEYVSSFSFDCYADGTACEQSFVGEESLDATLSAGRKTKGVVTFEVPQDAQSVEVEYLSNYWTSSRLVFDAMPK